jgi:hypothetical protein
LYLASLQGHENVVKMLLAKKGIDVNIDVYRTPLIAAITAGHENVVKNSGKKKKLALARVCESGARCFCVANSQEQVRIISSIFSSLKILDWPSYDFSRKKAIYISLWILGSLTR